MGEVGLAGEVRSVSQAERRLAECKRMGFTHVILPKGNLKGIQPPEGLKVFGVETLVQALTLLLGVGRTAESAETER